MSFCGSYDYIIGYENKVRELESVCLLKYELERRGHSVFVFQEFDQRYDDVMEVKYHAKVLILSCGYDDKYVEAFCGRFLTFDKLVNWQWEQVFDKSLEEDPNSVINIHGEVCRQAVQLSWGDFNVKRMTQLLELPKENVFKTGLISMDFVKPEFAAFYKSREEVLSEYGINPNYKVAILLGVFQAAFMTAEELDKLQSEMGIDYHETSIENRKRFDIEMDWILQALKADKNLYFIYRPHPGDEYDRCPEDVKQILDNIKAETGRFIVNQDYTVRQWFRVADKVYTGFSTTMVDAYFAGVSCRMLSPEGIPIRDEGILFDGAIETSTYSEFFDSLSDEQFVNPLNEDLIDGYYSIDEGLRYPVIANVLETVLKDDRYIIDTIAMRQRITDKKEKELSGKSLFKRIKLYLWKYDWFYNLYWKIMQLPIKSEYFTRQQSYWAKIQQYYKSYVGTSCEMLDIERRIDNCLKDK